MTGVRRRRWDGNIRIVSRLMFALAICHMPKAIPSPSAFVIYDSISYRSRRCDGG